MPIAASTTGGRVKGWRDRAGHVASVRRAWRGSLALVTSRPCSKVACGDDAVATLTYDYADAMAVLGPLAGRHEPHSYDLCARHAERLSAPQGWQVVRHSISRDTVA